MRTAWTERMCNEVKEQADCNAETDLLIAEDNLMALLEVLREELDIVQDKLDGISWKKRHE